MTDDEYVTEALEARDEREEQQRVDGTRARAAAKVGRGERPDWLVMMTTQHGDGPAFRGSLKECKAWLADPHNTRHAGRAEWRLRREGSE